jgi:hypothetical protein
LHNIFSVAINKEYYGIFGFSCVLPFEVEKYRFYKAQENKENKEK